MNLVIKYLKAEGKLEDSKEVPPMVLLRSAASLKITGNGVSFHLKAAVT